jgi:hypothetical protein
MREWIGREDRIVEDHRLGLAKEEADFQLVPELLGISVRLAVPKPVEPGRASSRCPRRWWAIVKKTQSFGVVSGFWNRIPFLRTKRDRSAVADDLLFGARCGKLTVCRRRAYHAGRLKS